MIILDTNVILKVTPNEPVAANNDVVPRLIRQGEIKDLNDSNKKRLRKRAVLAKN